MADSSRKGTKAGLKYSGLLPATAKRQKTLESWCGVGCPPCLQGHPLLTFGGKTSSLGLQGVPHPRSGPSSVTTRACEMSGVGGQNVHLALCPLFPVATSVGHGMSHPHVD